MKICAIGDPHGSIEKIKKISLKGVDLILLTGDIGKADLAKNFEFRNLERKHKGLPEIKETEKYVRECLEEIYFSTIKALRYLSKYAPVYIITGNVWMTDRGVKQDEKKFKIKLPHLIKDIKKMQNVYFARNKLKKFNRLKIGFLEYFADTCWIREFRLKDYAKSMKRAKKQTEKAKKILKKFGNLDILVCHQPPYGILDKVTFSGAPSHWKGKHAGSKTILDYIKKYQPKYVFCGHIHEGEGKTKIRKTEVYNLGVAGHKIINL